MICDRCGAPLPKNSKYCAECGAPAVHHQAPRMRVRDEYAQRVFTFGCLLVAVLAAVLALVVGLFSRPLGVLAAFATIVAGVVFMRVLFGPTRR